MTFCVITASFRVVLLVNFQNSSSSHLTFKDLELSLVQCAKFSNIIFCLTFIYICHFCGLKDNIDLLIASTIW